MSLFARDRPSLCCHPDIITTVASVYSQPRSSLDSNDTTPLVNREMFPRSVKAEFSGHQSCSRT